LEVGQWVSGDDAPEGGFAHTLLYGRPEVSWDRATHDARRVDDARSGGLRLDLEEDVAELAVATGLPLVPALRLRLATDRLAVRDARRAHLHLDTELVLQVMHRDLDRRLADRREDRLVRRVLAADVQRRILV